MLKKPIFSTLHASQRPDFVREDVVRGTLLAATLAAALILGGSSRSDDVTSPLLWPVSVGLGVGALLACGQQRALWPRGPVVWCCCLLILAVGYSAPLPATIWSTLPGREAIAAVDRLAFGGLPHRAASIAPDATHLFLADLFLPFATFLLAVGLRERTHAAVQAGLVLFGVASALLAVLQVNQIGGQTWQIHTIANEGEACGFFANRNHFALLLCALIPIFFHWAGDVIERRLGTHSWVSRSLAWTGVMTIIAWTLLLVLLAGARAGILGGVIALASLLLLMPRRDLKKPAVVRWMTVGFVVFVAALVAIALGAGRAIAIERLLQSTTDDPRIELWSETTRLIELFWPMGSGPGTFPTAFALHEPDSLLSPTYANHAHNDWLETVATLGLPGVMLIASGLGLFAARLMRVCDRDTRFWGFRRHCCGTSVILILLIGSIVDYPLRTPALGCLFALACAWLWSGTGRSVEGAATSPTANNPEDNSR